MSHRKRIIILSALALVFVSAVVLVSIFSADKRESFLPNYSTYFTDQFGTHALYRVLDDQGFEVQKNYRNFERVKDFWGRNYLIIAPLEEPLPAARESMLNWVENGSCLIVTPRGGQDFIEEAGIRIGEVEDVNEYVRAQGGFNASIPDNLTLMADRVEFMPEETPNEIKGVPQVQKGRQMNYAFAHHFLSDDQTVMPLFENDKGEVLVGFVRYGEGGIYLVSNPYIFTNAGLKKKENARFVLALFERINKQFPGEFVFDEYHHGFHVEEVATPLRYAEVRYMLWGLLLTFAALVWSFGKRDRKALPVIRTKRRAIGEFLGAMATIHKRKGGEEFLYSEIIGRFRARVAASLGLLEKHLDTDTTKLSANAQSRWGGQAGKEIVSILKAAKEADHTETRFRAVKRVREFALQHKLDLHG